MKIAVIGSGISGLSCAWLLNRKEGVDVTLFESGDYLGGHSNTVDVTINGLTHPVDTGFLVHNPNTYPNLIAFLKFLNVEVIDSDMTFSVKLGEKKIEWAGTDLTTVFSQKKNLFSPSFWKMILDIIHFNKRTHEYLEYSRLKKLSLGELLKEKNYSKEFCDWYLIPMGAAIWSTSTEDMEKFPAENFIQFGINHSLFQVEGRPVWRTVKNGSREYVKKIAADLPRIFLNEAVIAVTRGEQVEVITKNRTEKYDKIVFATHTDITSSILKDASAAEKDVLDNVQYSENIAYLHCDETLLPDSKKVWSAWNYFSETDDKNNRGVAVSYLISKLQPLPFKEPIVVTLNPMRVPQASKILKKIIYHHPMFDQKAIDSQKKLINIQGKNNTYFAGAWCGYGFHEDGLNSGIAVAKMLGAGVPW
ncbi:MAG: FAD-dependent oxidoreductase [Rhizobacter sp.]|nr:FAD-dependent oxidoreductase [Bacteriovorax sp.]